MLFNKVAIRHVVRSAIFLLTEKLFWEGVVNK